MISVFDDLPEAHSLRLYTYFELADRNSSFEDNSLSLITIAGITNERSQIADNSNDQIVSSISEWRDIAKDFLV